MSNDNSVIAYEGVSRINGAPIVVIISGILEPSSNGKTGDMLQAYILRSDIPPLEALETGKDSAICGGCPFRKALRGGCYVNVGQAPRGIWECYKNGAGYEYCTDPASLFRRTDRIRLGAYGDPVAAPLEMWQSLVSHSAGWTGYAHQWRAKMARGFSSILQASCDSIADQEEATARGWGTFRVSALGDRDTVPGEFYCPAPAIDCRDCLRCDGASGAAVLIEAHGSGAGKVAP